MSDKKTCSSSLKLHNDVLSYELNSDKIIPPTSYYIVKLRFIDKNLKASKAKEIVKAASSCEYDSEIPLAVYRFKNALYLIFSSFEDGISGKHFMNGSQQKICSYFVSKYAKTTKTDVECSIVELDSRIKLLVYFQTKVYEAAKEFACDCFKGSKKQQEVRDMTLKEIEDSLSSLSTPIIWKEVDSFDKYGMFYKYIKRKDKYLYLSEMINAENLEKFRKYLFS